MKSKSVFSRGFFLKIMALCMVSIQERFLIKSGLWWRVYGTLKTSNNCLLNLLWTWSFLLACFGYSRWPIFLFRPFQTYISSLCIAARFKLDPFNAYSADSLSANETFLPIRNGILLPKLFWLTVRKKCSSD